MMPKFDRIKSFRSEGYNFDFDRMTGDFRRWGKTEEDDPQMSPFGPEILDIEVGTICNGIGKPCPWCYKSNSPIGENMSLETFKKILSKFPKTLCQVAFGLGDIDGNPDLFKIMEYCRYNSYNKVIPNITINGYNLTDPYAKQLVELCGAVSVSRYRPKDVCYDAVKKLTDLGLTQCNIHMLAAKDTYEECLDLLKDVREDHRLKNINAVIFLLLKPKGKRNKFDSLTLSEYKNIIRYAMDNKISVGTDSCAAPLFMQSLTDEEFKENIKYIECCESFGLFSSYVNVRGDYFPCSFAEDVGEWVSGISVLSCDNFIKDVWFSEKLNRWRGISLNASSSCQCSFAKHCRPCPLYDIYPCKENSSAV